MASSPALAGRPLRRGARGAAGVLELGCAVGRAAASRCGSCGHRLVGPAGGTLPIGPCRPGGRRRRRTAAVPDGVRRRTGAGAPGGRHGARRRAGSLGAGRDGRGGCRDGRHDATLTGQLAAAGGLGALRRRGVPRAARRGARALGFGGGAAASARRARRRRVRRLRGPGGGAHLPRRGGLLRRRSAPDPRPGAAPASRQGALAGFGLGCRQAQRRALAAWAGRAGRAARACDGCGAAGCGRCGSAAGRTGRAAPGACASRPPPSARGPRDMPGRLPRPGPPFSVSVFLPRQCHRCACRRYQPCIFASLSFVRSRQKVTVNRRRPVSISVGFGSNETGQSARPLPLPIGLLPLW